MKQADAGGNGVNEKRSKLVRQHRVLAGSTPAHIVDSCHDPGGAKRAPNGADMLAASGVVEREAEQRNGGKGGRRHLGYLHGRGGQGECSSTVVANKRR